MTSSHFDLLSSNTVTSLNVLGYSYQPIVFRRTATFWSRKAYISCLRLLNIVPKLNMIGGVKFICSYPGRPLVWVLLVWHSSVLGEPWPVHSSGRPSKYSCSWREPLRWGESAAKSRKVRLTSSSEVSEHTSKISLEFLLHIPDSSLFHLSWFTIWLPNFHIRTVNNVCMPVVFVRLLLLSLS